MRKREHKCKIAVRPTGVESDERLIYPKYRSSIMSIALSSWQCFRNHKKLQDHMVLCVSVNYHLSQEGLKNILAMEYNVKRGFSQHQTIWLHDTGNHVLKYYIYIYQFKYYKI